MLTIDSNVLAGISSRPNSHSLPDSTPGRRRGVVGFGWKKRLELLPEAIEYAEDEHIFENNIFTCHIYMEGIL